MRLIDADALIEILKQWQMNAEKSRPDDIGLVEFNYGVMGLAQAAVTQMPTRTADDLRENWISVKERLQASGERVWFFLAKTQK